MGNINISLLTSQRRHCRKRNLHLLANHLNSALGMELVEPNARDDLCLSDGGSKISGTAARVSQGRAYHHLTLLVEADLERMKKALHSPLRTKIETNATRSESINCPSPSRDFKILKI